MTVAAPSKRRFAAILVSGALFSKLLGFVREVLMAHVLGASLVADGFRGAITAILIPLAVLQNETVPAVLIPMHRDKLKDDDAPKHLAALTIVLTGLAIGITALIEGLGSWWVDAIVGGFGPEGKSLTLDFVRIMALGMPASVMLNVLAAGEIALGRTRLTNIRASLLNVATLIGIALLTLTGEVQIIAWSFMLAFNVLATWALISMWREGLLDFRGLTLADVRASGAEFLHRLKPLLALPMAEQGNIWIERLLASRLVTGAVASLDYARTLTESAVLLISQPVGLSVLSVHPTQDEKAQVEAIARPVLALGLPASVFLVAFAVEIVRLVFQRGAFGEEAVLLTSHGLRGIAVGLWAATLGWILIRILNGAGRNGAAAIIIISAHAANTLVNLSTASWQTAGFNGTLLLGLGEATRSMVLLLGVVLALRCLRRLLPIMLLALIPAAIMGILGWQIHHVATGTIERLGLGLIAYGVSIAVALGLLMPQTCRLLMARLTSRLRS